MSKRTIKITIWCFVGVVVLSAIIIPIILTRIGWFEYNKRGVNYFFGNSKYDAQYFLDTNSYEFEAKQQGFDYLHEVDFDGNRYKLRIFSTDTYYQNHLFAIEFYAIVKFGGGVTTQPYAVVADPNDLHYTNNERIYITAKNSDGIVRNMTTRGGGATNDKNVDFYTWSHIGDDKQQYFESGDFIITISNVLIYKFTRK